MYSTIFLLSEGEPTILKDPIKHGQSDVSCFLKLILLYFMLQLLMYKINDNKYVKSYLPIK